MCLHTKLVQAELFFDNTKFELKSVTKVGTGAMERINQRYEAVGENRNQCVFYVSPRPKASVADMLSLDKMLNGPPLAIAPIEIFKNPAGTYKEDAMSIMLMRDLKDESKFTVILHRATLVGESMVREVEINCSLKYSGLFSKSTSEFEKVKASWVADAFRVEPELTAPQ